MEQLIYTSCRTGIENRGSGFQVYSHSAGIDSQMSAAMQRSICRYKVPISLSSRPSQQEINSDFPVSFKYVGLDEKTMCLCSSKYVGADYTGEDGRFGNFISHVITMRRGEADFYPIKFYDSAIFMSSLTKEQATSDAKPSYLASVNYDDLMSFKGENISFENVCRFIEKYDCIDELKTMIAAVFECRKSGKRILICDNKNDIPYWIAAITMAFPPRAAADITFDTYSYDPDESDALICGVFPEGTAYNIKLAKASGMYYIFDFIEKDIPDIDCDKYEFLDLIESGFEFSHESIKEFHQFLQRTGFRAADETINDAYKFYSFLRSPDDDYNDISDLAEFAKKLEPDAVGNDFVRAVDSLPPVSDAMRLKGLLGMLASICSKTEDRKLIANIYYEFINLIFKSVTDGDIPPENVLNAYEEAVSENPSFEEGILAGIFSQTKSNPFINTLFSSEDYKLSIIVLKLFYKKIAMDKIDAGNAIKIYAGVLYRAVNNFLALDNDLCIECLNTVFMGCDIKSGLSIYLAGIFAARDTLVSEAAKLYVDNLNENLKSDDRFDIIAEDLINGAPNPLARAILELVEKTITLSENPIEQWEKIEKLYEFKSSKLIRTRTDKTGLIRFACVFKKWCENEEEKDYVELKSLARTLPFNDTTEYEEHNLIVPLAKMAYKKPEIMFRALDVLRSLRINNAGIISENIISFLIDEFKKTSDDMAFLYSFYVCHWDPRAHKELEEKLSDIAVHIGTIRFEQIAHRATTIFDVKVYAPWLDFAEKVRNKRKKNFKDILKSVFFGGKKSEKEQSDEKKDSK